MAKNIMRNNIAPSSWKGDLAAFTERNQMRPTRMEVLGPKQDAHSEFWIEDGLLLVAVDLGTDGESGASVEIMLHAPNLNQNHMSHRIAGVKRVGLDTADGKDVGLEIENSEGTVTIMRFESGIAA